MPPEASVVLCMQAGRAAGVQGATVPAQFSADKLLLHLHGLDPKAEGVSAAAVVYGIDTAMHSPETFPQTVIASVRAHTALRCAALRCAALRWTAQPNPVRMR
jgi:hypothetical protein